MRLEPRNSCKEALSSRALFGSDRARSPLTRADNKGPPADSALPRSIGDQGRWFAALVALAESADRVAEDLRADHDEQDAHDHRVVASEPVPETVEYVPGSVSHCEVDHERRGHADRSHYREDEQDDCLAAVADAGSGDGGGG